MTARKILECLLGKFPGLHPQSTELVNGADLTQELTILMGSWEIIDRYPKRHVHQGISFFCNECIEQEKKR